MNQLTFDLRQPNTVWTQEAAESLVGQSVPFNDRQIDGTVLDLGKLQITHVKIIDSGAGLRITAEQT